MTWYTIVTAKTDDWHNTYKSSMLWTCNLFSKFLRLRLVRNKLKLSAKIFHVSTLTRFENEILSLVTITLSEILSSLRLKVNDCLHLIDKNWDNLLDKQANRQTIYFVSTKNYGIDPLIVSSYLSICLYGYLSGTEYLVSVLSKLNVAFSLSSCWTFSLNFWFSLSSFPTLALSEYTATFEITPTSLSSFFFKATGWPLK